MFKRNLHALIALVLIVSVLMVSPSLSFAEGSGNIAFLATASNNVAKEKQGSADHHRNLSSNKLIANSHTTFWNYSYRVEQTNVGQNNWQICSDGISTQITENADNSIDLDGFKNAVDSCAFYQNIAAIIISVGVIATIIGVVVGILTVATAAAIGLLIGAVAGTVAIGYLSASTIAAEDADFHFTSMK